ncbi:hypothetical protein [uncultured Methylobacterium sp.]|mgnify:CR=1 FL=1|uniref:hypothetical protein n=1 Tax=uncultured Methylobacterium sp. TaxID=157278 RepID=UPI002609483C|nr:hypothetical protein [uncultured Methylobacterium sp.]
MTASRPAPEFAAERALREAADTNDRTAADAAAVRDAFDRTIGATADRIRALQAREAATSTKGNRRD